MRFPSDKKTQGLIWVLVACISFPVMTAFVKQLRELGMSAGEVVFWRNSVALIFLIPFAFLRSAKVSLSINNKKLYFLRVVVGMASMVLWFQGLGMMELADSTALSFMQPIFTSILAVIILKEAMGVRRWSAVVAGFIGTLVILRPGFEEVNQGAYIILLACMFMSMALIIVKKLTSSETPFNMMFHMHLWFALLSLPMVFIDWSGISGGEFAWACGVAIFSILAQYSVAKSFSLMDVTLTMPFDFLRLVVASVVAYFMFNEIPDLWTFAGGGLIIGSAIYIAHREAVKKGKHEISKNSGLM